MKFKGDIIITDPCYIIRKDRNNDWRKCDYGSNMEALGIKTYMTRDTIYGDWSCHTFNTETNEPIGEFCADAGLVSVFLLDEVLKYNPEFDYHLNRKWTTTLIKDFDGDITMEVVEFEEDDYEFDEETYELIPTGKKITDEEVRVIGTGNINFYTSQTGL